MIRSAHAVLLALFAAVVTLPLAAQSSQFEADSTHYHVISEISQEHAQAVSDRMEAMLSLYNQQFRYPVDSLEAPLRVRVFATKSRFDSYLRRLVDETRDGYVYLHYADLAKSELVGYYTDDASLDQSIIHQSFIQFFRAFVDNPPLWLREGFAVYFEASQYDPEFGTAIYRENLAWLDTLKAMVAGDSPRPLIGLDEMLSIDLDGARSSIDSFYPQAWGMISFLLNADAPEINRIMWDSLSALQPDASLAENVDAVYREAFRWVDQGNLTDDFLAYVGERRSFRGWVSYGVDQYTAGELDEAESAFVKSLQLREDNYVPYYYLGLINYERQNYGLADFYYQAAMERGADEAITLYALGVNAYADNRFDEAADYLQMTVDEDPGYRERAEGLLIRIRG